MAKAYDELAVEINAGKYPAAKEARAALDQKYGGIMRAN